jgi:hypothetical protein
MGVSAHSTGKDNVRGGKPINHDMLLDPKRSCAPFCQSREREGTSSLSPTLAAVLSALTGWRACVHRIPPPVWLCLPSCQPIIPKPRGVSPWVTGVGWQDTFQIGPARPLSVSCDAIAWLSAERRKEPRMSHDTTGPDRHRPILHLRRAIGSTSIAGPDSTCLSPVDRATEQGTGRNRPDAARRKRQGGRREE